MNNYNGTQISPPMIMVEAILGHGLITADKSRTQESSSRPGNWRRRWLSQPVNRESQEQRWRRQGKLQ